MTAIWKEDEERWTLLSPSGFPDEDTLHTLVDRAPHLLPLSGNPSLAILGKEVAIGGNRADLIAVEPSGRLAIIEIKLAQNAESRRAVITQILTYAALLRGMDADTLERQILAEHLRARGFESLMSAAQSSDQLGALDAEIFHEGLADSLRAGAFRLVLVLDQAPPELVRLVGYLEAISDKLLIDLMTVESYEIGGSRVVIPRRVDPEREPVPTIRHNQRATSSADTGIYNLGAAEFLASIETAAPDHRAALRTMAAWGAQLEKEGWVKLATYQGKSGRVTLLPRIPGENAGLVTIWNDGAPYLSFWRSVFERCAPESLRRFDEDASLPRIGQGNTTKDLSSRLLDELTRAYRESASGRVSSNEMEM